MGLNKEYCKRCKKETTHYVRESIKICVMCYQPIEETVETKEKQFGLYMLKEKEYC